MKALKIMDILSQKDVSNYYNLYSRTQWYSKKEMEEFQLMKLRELIQHCYENVPYYTELMQMNNIHPNDIKSIYDINVFPIITKEIIKENFQAFIPNNIKRIKNVKYGQTGGTTGSILFKRTDTATRSSTWAVYRRFYDWMGIKESDKNILIKGGHVAKHNMFNQIKACVINILKNSIRYDAYNSTQKNVEELIPVLSTGRIRLIRGYSQNLYELAKEFEKRKLVFNVKAIMTTAEPLMQTHRKLFAKVFNAETYDQYGCGEIGGIAFECEKHEGLHVSEERVLIEVNQNNELIITDLDNFAMPYIRYWNADEVELSNQNCSCGRQSMLINKVLGRTCDYIVGVNGEKLHWAYFWHLMFDTEIALKRNIIKFQVLQTNPNQILYRTVGDMLTEKDQNTIKELMIKKLGTIEIVFVNEKDIENAPSGKYRPVVRLNEAGE
jgi:phenylacetate-CoA ligase